ncbi:hypothetical protein [Oceanobacillus oncorhynchi]|uniref:hypothetical protein n=1 Tax=Oceanobacillus oncorhynchi TaxID=545501 RepID=UPI0031CE2EBB
MESVVFFRSGRINLTTLLRLLAPSKTFVRRKAKRSVATVLYTSPSILCHRSHQRNDQFLFLWK